MRRPRAAVFDMDGTMLDTEPLAARAWLEAASALTIEFDESLPDAMIGRNFADCEAMIRARHGAAYPTVALMRAWHEAYDAILRRDGIALKPGVLALLSWLEAERIPCAVATSTRRARALAKLELTSLARHFEVVVGGDEVARGKPAPDIYLAAAQRLRAEPSACLALEDSEPGVRSALAAGMTVVMVPDVRPPSPELLEVQPWVFGSLVDVHAHLASLPP